MKTPFPGFPPEARKFLRDLKANNTREWFQARKQIYEQQVRAPMTELVLALGEELREAAPELLTDPKKAIYRIYRDVRFSRDKSPYKTHIAATFGPRGLEKHTGAGTYFHIAPDEVLVAGGVYMPGSRELLAIRQHVASHSGELRRILKERSFRKAFGGLQGERLKRVPKGFASGHPAADLLVHKQFLAFAHLPPELAETPKLYKELLKHFQVMLPFLRFLNAPLMKPSRDLRAGVSGL